MIAISIPGRSRVLFCFHAFGFLHDCIQSITSPLSHLSTPLLLLLYCQQLHNVLVLHLLQHLRSGQQEFSTCTHCKMVLIGTDLELPHLNLLRSHVWQLVECLHLKCKSHELDQSTIFVHFKWIGLFGQYEYIVNLSLPISIQSLTATVSPLCLFTPWNTAPVAPLPSTLQSVEYHPKSKKKDIQYHPMKHKHWVILSLTHIPNGFTSLCTTHS